LIEIIDNKFLFLDIQNGKAGVHVHLVV